jgi:hypothetical protein
MKFSATITAACLLGDGASAFSFVPSALQIGAVKASASRSALPMVLQEPPAKTKKLQKIETLKINSDYLLKPLKKVRL